MSTPVPEDAGDGFDADELDRRAEEAIDGENCLSWDEHMERVRADE